ncbi:hypothetical protein MCOR25_009740 [Pyricularia grisea]|uniref:Trichothecene 3-O-acetyltransferase-like N-terminal domain-containing protein n=1 Tax=Pyricularia grisea TaxID=148305 RepID=A0A6P8AXH5_PYRGI|nr:hypothetical protein PgNI_10927 [Pyricularia grisea]KAI6351789.1 hypothetical protein MCOR25_009740 [Pyricularia grisea]TLD07050.1 hypothetical protein PgNI_10927 [Pyricularia grisea]
MDSLASLPAHAGNVTIVQQISRHAEAETGGVPANAPSSQVDKEDPTTEEVINLSVFDLIPPRTFIKFILYIPLKNGTSYKTAFAHLHEGLSRTLDRIPFLDGKVFERPQSEPGYVKGHLQIRYDKTRKPGSSPRQLTFRDLAAKLPSFEELRDSGFEFSAVNDNLVLESAFIPDITAGADVFRAQANFVQGGCLLATGFHHSSMDATGMVTVLKAWSEHCRAIGNSEPVCPWLTPECIDRGILERLWKKGWDANRSIADIDPATWGYLGFQVPGTEAKTEEELCDQGTTPSYMQNSSMESSIFYISTSQMAELLGDIQHLHESADEDLQDDQQLSANDILLALFWRALLRARYRAAAASGTPPPADAVAHLESPLDGRAAFSADLPAAYIGNVVTVNKVSLKLEELILPGPEALRRVAWLVRRGARRAGPGMVRDAYALMQSTRDFSALRHGFTRLDGWDVMITSVLLLPMQDMDFGGGSSGGLLGQTEALRPLMDAFNANFRLCMILPRNLGGGLELLVSLFPEEMAELEQDEEFGRFAALLCH